MSSEQITVYNSYSAERQSFSFKVSGRAPSLVPKGQGDHVTAFALVKRGIARHLKEVIIKREEDLSKIREMRDKVVLDGYVANVLAISPSHRDDFIKTIPDIQDNYNDQRIKKSDIGNCKELYTSLEKRQDVIPSPDHLKSFGTIINQAYIVDATYMCGQIGEITRSFLTQYNKIPGVTFEKISGLSSTSSEGPEVKKALEYFDGIDKRTEELEISRRQLNKNLTWLYSKDAEDDSQENQDKLKELMISKEQGKTKSTVIVGGGRSYTKHLGNQREEAKEDSDQVTGALRNHRTDPKTIAQNLFKLFFYPKVSDEYASQTKLMSERNENVVTRRDNNLNAFYDYMARHLHIAFSAYPEFFNDVNRDAVIEEFVKLNLHAKSNPNGWKVNLEEVTNQVLLRIAKIEGTVESITEQCRSRHSSVDEKDKPNLEDLNKEHPATKEKGKASEDDDKNIIIDKGKMGFNNTSGL